MGRMYQLKCGKCGYDFKAFLGTGYFFPMDYKNVLKDAREGNLGKTLQQFMLEHPNAALNCNRVLLQCTGCGELKNDYDLSMYIPKSDSSSRRGGKWSVGFPCEDMDYATPSELSDYQFVGAYNHTCEKCGKPMKMIDEKSINQFLERGSLSMVMSFQPEAVPLEIKCPVCKEKLYLDKMGIWD